jgi:dynein assembly factor with WDR repeat domains 1
MFNPQGTQLLTASGDHTCKLWSAVSGDCMQTFQGHTDEVFSCAFNYEGNTIITAGKDNSCQIWGAVHAK